jgi:hypothetical protein
MLVHLAISELVFRLGVFLKPVVEHPVGPRYEPLLPAVDDALVIDARPLPGPEVVRVVGTYLLMGAH